jgi:hypothetical protein
MRIEQEFIIKDQEHLDALLTEWIDILGLNEWEIYAKFSMPPDSLARNNYNYVNKQSTIIIMPENCYDYVFAWDMEETLVHELLHLKLHVLDPHGDGIEYGIFHSKLEEMARALVKAKRKGK